MVTKNDLFDPGDPDIPGGKTFNEWTREWWNWLLKIPVDQSPAIDPTGEHADNDLTNNDDHVYFVAGEYNGSSIRTINKLPHQKAVLVGILNAEWNPTQDPDLNRNGCDHQAEKEMNDPTTLELHIDEGKLGAFHLHKADLVKYRVDTDVDGSPFFTLVSVASSNIFNTAAGDLQDAAGDGYWAFFRPGVFNDGKQHTVYFKGSMTSFSTEVYLTLMP